MTVPMSNGGSETMKKVLVTTLALAAAFVSILPGICVAGINMQHNQNSL
jgi:hypothetical protein